MSQNAKKIISITDNIKTAKAYLNKAYIRAEQELKDTQKIIDRDYKASSPTYKQKQDEAKAKYNSMIEQVKTELRNGLNDQIETLRIAEVTALKNINPEKIAKLSVLEGIPLSRAELEVLVEAYGNNNYWVDRKLEQLASDNGFNEFGTDLDLEPNFEVKNKSLTELQNDLNLYIDEFNGELSYKLENMLSDARLNRTEEAYTNGRVNNMFSLSQKVERIVEQVAQGRNILEQSKTLANIWATADTREKDYLAHEIIKSGKLNPQMLAYTEVDEYLNAFKTDGLYIKFENALNEITKATNSEDVGEIKVIIENNAENEYFNEMLQDVSEKGKIAEALN